MVVGEASLRRRLADKKELMLGAWEGCGDRACQVGETASAKALRLYHTQCLSNSKELSVAETSLVAGRGVLGAREEIMEGLWVPVSKDLGFFSG